MLSGKATLLFSFLPPFLWQSSLNRKNLLLVTGNKLEGDVGDKVSLQALTSPYFQPREKFKCIEHTDKSETWLKTSP